MGVLFNYPKFFAHNDSGGPLVGGLLYAYAAGTTTPKTTYSDYDLTSANTNPVVLDKRGESAVFGSGIYKFILKDAALNTVWTMDNIDGVGGSGFKTILNYPGSDDEARMMNMLADTGAIVIPCGYNALVDPMEITTLKCKIVGLGGWATIKLKDNSNDDLIRFVGTGSGGGYFGTENIWFDGNAANQSGSQDIAVIRCRNASYTILRHNVVINGYGDGVVLENFNGDSDADEINVADNFIFSNGRDGLSLKMIGSPLQAPGDMMIGPNNHINYNGRTGLSCNYDDVEWAGTAITVHLNNILTNVACGMKFVQCFRFIITANQARYNGAQGLLGEYLSESQIIGNQFHLNTRAGTATNLDLWYCVDDVINGNHCNDQNFTPINLYGGQFAHCTGLAITGNIFQGTVAGTSITSDTTYKASGNIGLPDGCSVTTVTDTHNILTSEEVTVCNKATPFTVTLPTALPGQIFTIKNIGAGTVSVEGYGAETIDGAANQTISQWGVLIIQCSTIMEWIILSHDFEYPINIEGGVW